MSVDTCPIVIVQLFTSSCWRWWRWHFLRVRLWRRRPCGCTFWVTLLFTGCTRLLPPANNAGDRFDDARLSSRAALIAWPSSWSSRPLTAMTWLLSADWHLVPGRGETGDRRWPTLRSASQATCATTLSSSCTLRAVEQRRCASLELAGKLL